MKHSCSLPQWLLISLIIIPTLACGPGLSQSTPTPTKTPNRVRTVVPLATVTPTVAVIIPPPAQNEALPEEPTAAAVEPTATPVPAEPTATPVPTEAPVTITVLQNMNVRSGPGTNYPVIGAGSPGESTRVLGRNSDSTWLQVEYPVADGLGWIYGPLVQVNGDPETVAIASAPPPPPPTNTPIPPPTVPLPTAPPAAPPPGPAKAETDVVIELPEGNTYDPGDKFKIVFIVRNPNGVKNFTWGIFLQNLTPLIGGQKACNNVPECTHVQEVVAPPLTGIYIVGADVANSKGGIDRGIGEIYVR